MKQYDTVELKDGRTGVIVEIFDDGFMVDVGSSPKDWDTIFVKNDEIKGLAQIPPVRKWQVVFLYFFLENCTGAREGGEQDEGKSNS